MKSSGLRARSLDDFAKLVFPRFVKIAGCVFVEREYGTTKGLPEWSRTHREAMTNHVHVLDYFVHRAWGNGSRSRYVAGHPDFKAAWAVGHAIACAWHMKLKADFPRERFCVYLYATRNDGPVVTFHRVRGGEKNHLDAARARRPPFVCGAVILGAKNGGR